MDYSFDVKALRKSLGLNQKDFAARCGVSQRTVQYWESGGTLTAPVVEMLKALADGSGVDGGAIIAPVTSSGSGVSVAAAGGANVNVGSETARFLSLLEKKDEQIDRLLSVIEKMQNGK